MLGSAFHCSWKRFCIESKLSLSFAGVILVMISVGASIGNWIFKHHVCNLKLRLFCPIGLFGFCQVPATLIIFEILPFLVLAVGVDNIFIMVEGFQKSSKLEHELDYQHLGRVMGEVTPSMFVSSAAQVRIFFASEC